MRLSRFGHGANTLPALLAALVIAGCGGSGDAMSSRVSTSAKEPVAESPAAWSHKEGVTQISLADGSKAAELTLDAAQEPVGAPFGSTQAVASTGSGSTSSSLSNATDALRSATGSSDTAIQPIAWSPGGAGGELEQCRTDSRRTVNERSAILSIVRSMPGNSWRRVNENTFASVQMPTAWRPNCSSGVGPNGIINAWGGFAYDSNRGDLITFGGGHADYCGNDVYRFRLATLRWERAGISSQMKKYQISETLQTGVPVDGLANAPQTSHMYDQLTFMPLVDRMIYFGGRPFWGGRNAEPLNFPVHPNTGPWLFDPAKAEPDRVVGTTGSAVDPSIEGGRMWQNREFASNHPGAYLPAGYGITASSATACRNGHDVVFMRASTQSSTGSVLILYEAPEIDAPGNDRLVRISANNNHMKQADLAVDPARAIAVLTGDSESRPLTFWDLESAGASNPLQVIRGLESDGTWTYSATYGMDFDGSRGRFLLWDGASTVWELLAPVGTRVSTTGWRISKLVDQGGPTGTPLSRSGGANGKWKYAPDLDVFVGLREAPNGDVWIYKPDNWNDPALQ